MKTQVVAVLLAAATLAACGESDEDRAQAQVCDARARIATEVDKLGELSPSTVTADAVRDSVRSIGGDLEQIVDAADDVSEDRREDLKAANQAFAAQVRDVGSNVLRSTSVAEAQTQLAAALDELAATYRSTLGTFDCG